MTLPLRFATQPAPLVQGEQAEFLSYGLLYATAQEDAGRLLAHEMKEGFAAAQQLLQDERFVCHALAGGWGQLGGRGWVGWV